MADLIYRNALRAARELWFDEQNLGELIQDPATVSQLRQANEVSYVYEVPRARLRPGLPAAGEDENWPPRGA
jgi:hypothetical protein